MKTTEDEESADDTDEDSAHGTTEWPAKLRRCQWSCNSRWNFTDGDSKHSKSTIKQKEMSSKKSKDALSSKAADDEDGKYSRTADEPIKILKV
jgi:hypothetical protein